MIHDVDTMRIERVQPFETSGPVFPVRPRVNEATVDAARLVENEVSQVSEQAVDPVELTGRQNETRRIQPLESEAVSVEISNRPFDEEPELTYRALRTEIIQESADEARALEFNETELAIGVAGSALQEDVAVDPIPQNEFDNSANISRIGSETTPTQQAPGSEGTVQLKQSANQLEVQPVPTDSDAARKNEQKISLSNKNSEETKEEKAEKEKENKEVQELKQRDSEVRRHEQAHKSTLGSYAAGGIQYDYTRGPNGVQYAVGGSVAVDLSEEDAPEKTIPKAQTIRRAALAPADPSPADRQVAAQASQLENAARAEIRKEELEEEKNAKNGDSTETTLLAGIQMYQQQSQFSSGRTEAGSLLEAVL